MLEYRLDYLVCRSLSMDLRNARERLEAYKFIRRLFHLYPQRFPHSFVYILDSIVSSSQLISSTRNNNQTQLIRSDQMVKCCLELLCEIGKKFSFDRRSLSFNSHSISFTKSTYSS